jgi:predicted CXXCH cytochrome family protein
MNGKIALSALATVCLVTLFSLNAGAASIVGSKHDFASSGSGTNPSNFGGQFYRGSVAPQNKITETCIFCHTPHRASTDSANNLNSRLWNRVVSQRVGAPTYLLFTSTSSSFVSQNPTGLSLMCLSCHDGVTAIGVSAGGANALLNSGPGNPQIVLGPGVVNAIGDIYYPGSFAGDGPNIGGMSPGSPWDSGPVDLSNDHPVSFPWSATNGIPGLIKPTSGPLRLFGLAERMECSTCHNVHDPSIPPFLAMSNTNSAMCQACHNK